MSGSHQRGSVGIQPESSCAWSVRLQPDPHRVRSNARATRAFAILLAAIAAAGCGRAREDLLLAVALPDMSRSDAPVQKQARERYANVQRKLEADAPDDELGLAFGELGMLLHAAEYLEPAEPAYRNAQTLSPSDSRWPYYLGHLYRTRGDPTKAMAAFETARALRPSDVPTLVWLGRTYLDGGRADAAEPLFARAHELEPRAPAPLAGSGQVALARRDYAGATILLEKALAAEPRAASLHAPLASAYRALGETEKADAHVGQWSNTEVPLHDPLSDRLATTIQSGVSYETRGVRAFEGGDLHGAADLFRRGLDITPPATPLGRSLRQKLALALYLAGDPAAAMAEYEEAIRLAPAAGPDQPAAQAHYGLGIIMAAAGKPGDAIEHLTRAVNYDPTYVQARLALADALRARGRFADALSHYEHLSSGPRAAEARFGSALALVRLGRWTDARDILEGAVRAHPDRPELAHALARILAAAPDSRARDGERAFAIAQELLKSSARTEVGETLAMAYAELGEFERAAAVLRGVIEATLRAGPQQAARHMSETLRRYERRQASRQPWASEDPVHHPGPPVSPELAAISERRRADSNP